MANLKSQLAAIAILGLPIFIAAAVFGPAAFDLAFHRRPPERYLVPAGFTGWVRVDYRQKNAPPLPVEDGHRVYKFNEQGIIATSADQFSGHGKDEFFYYSGNQRKPLSTAGVCKGGMIWQPQTLIDPRTSLPYARFFVGTEDQYRHEVDPQGRTLPNCG